MKILPSINYPQDVRKLSIDELKTLSEEIRDYLVDIIPSIGGHFASSLGVVELTIALHHLYQTPQDLLIWDVGHQAYVHKILTGRKASFRQIRQYGGISGFLKRNESVYDIMGAGHASTSISAALGFATARDLKGENHKVVAIIGDGALTGGLAYEGLNNAGHSEKDFLVVLNDNNMSISPNVGAIAYYLNDIITNPLYQKIKNEVWDLTEKIPPFTNKIRTIARRAQGSIKSFILPGMFFEDLGFRYFGPVDGHNMDELLQILRRVKDLPGPKLLHVLTKKGKGFLEAEQHPAKYHGIKPINATSKEKSTISFQSYTDIFGQTMADLAENNEKVCAITAAMCDGTGLNNFRDKYPERFFDVGIAEEHAVTFAAGLAGGGYRPVVSIYSTFLQRSYDQIIHDVALQKLPVVFAVDRGGLVGEDGPTHHGTLDLSYLNVIPNLIIASPKDGQEFRDLLYTSLSQERLPFAIRYPRDYSPGIVHYDADYQQIPIGSWEILQKGRDVAILAVGSMVKESLDALKVLNNNGIEPTVVNCRYIKPLDVDLLRELLQSHRFVYTLEENALEGGFGHKIAAYIQQNNPEAQIRLKMRGIPDQFVEQGAREILLKKCGLTADNIANWILGDQYESSIFSYRNQHRKNS